MHPYTRLPRKGNVETPVTSPSRSSPLGVTKLSEEPRRSTLRKKRAALLLPYQKTLFQDLKAIHGYYNDHFSKLDADRIAEMRRGLISLCEEWSQAAEEEKNATLPNYRNSVVYNQSAT